MAITRLASLEPTTSAASFTTISGAYKALIIMGQTKSDDSSSGTTMSSQIAAPTIGKTLSTLLVLVTAEQTTVLALLKLNVIGNRRTAIPRILAGAAGMF
jgi:hypothetical protein